MIKDCSKGAEGNAERNVCLHQTQAAWSENTSWRGCPELKFEDSDLSETGGKAIPISGSTTSYPQCHLLPPLPWEAETLDTKQEKVVEIFSLRRGAIDSAQGDWPRQGEAGRIMREGNMQNPGQERVIMGLSLNLEERQYCFCPHAGYGQSLPEKYSEIFRNSLVTSSLNLSETSE